MQQGTYLHRFQDVPELVVKDGDTSCSFTDDAASDCSTALGHQDIKEDPLGDLTSECGVDVETLLIFDWDDTLLPTTWLQQQGLLVAGAECSSEQAELLREVAASARQALEIGMRIGKVVIVTNAQDGWVEMSCRKFMPSLSNLLQQLDIVSARSSYESYAQDPSEWKRLAFAQEVHRFYGPSDHGNQRNVMSVGDSLHELRALMSVAEATPYCRGKSLKLWESPTVEQLIEQHSFLVENLWDVAEHDGHLDVEIGTDNFE